MLQSTKEKNNQIIQTPKVRLSICGLYFMLPVKQVALLPGATKKKCEGFCCGPHVIVPRLNLQEKEGRIPVCTNEK